MTTMKQDSGIDIEVVQSGLPDGWRAREGDGMVYIYPTDRGRPIAPWAAGASFGINETEDGDYMATQNHIRRVDGAIEHGMVDKVIDSLDMCVAWVAERALESEHQEPKLPGDDLHSFKTAGGFVEFMGDDETELIRADNSVVLEDEI